MDKTRNLSFDIAKGIVIILMVLGHSGCPEYLSNLIYSFHMPCFFLISGYLLKEHYFLEKKLFVRRKFKGIYFPFIKRSLIFLVFHNLFTILHLYDNTYHLVDFKFKVFQILTMTGTEQLLGGFWFLKELLYASIIGFFCIYCLESFGMKERKKILFILPIAFVLLAYLLSIAPFKIPTIGSKTMLACGYYTLGYALRVLKFKLPTFSIIPLIILLASIPFFFSGSMDVTGKDIFIYFLSSLLGCGIILCLSNMLSKSHLVTSALSQIGQSTLYILIFHFISFKLVSYIVININNWPLEKLSSFPILSTNYHYLWIVYGTVGVAVPFFIWKISKANWKFLIINH